MQSQLIWKTTNCILQNSSYPLESTINGNEKTAPKRGSKKKKKKKKKEKRKKCNSYNHYLPSRVNTCAQCVHLTYPCTKRKVLSLTKPRGVMVKAMNCGIVVREFVLQSRYYVHFRANTLGKGMNPLILPPAMGK